MVLAAEQAVEDRRPAAVPVRNAVAAAVDAIEHDRRIRGAARPALDRDIGAVVRIEIRQGPLLRRPGAAVEVPSKASVALVESTLPPRVNRPISPPA